MTRPRLSPHNPLAIIYQVKIDDTLLSIFHGAVHAAVERRRKKIASYGPDVPPDRLEASKALLEMDEWALAQAEIIRGEAVADGPPTLLENGWQDNYRKRGIFG